MSYRSPARTVAEWILGQKPHCDCDPDTGAVPCMNCADRDLAEMYLKQNKIDDCEAPNRQWLLSLGCFDENINGRLDHKRCWLRQWYKSDITVEEAKTSHMEQCDLWRIGCLTSVATISTKGQMRRLLELFGELYGNVCSETS